MSSSTLRLLVLVRPLFLFVACTPDDVSSPDDETADDTTDVPATYSYDSRFGDEDSVSYAGQIFRHVLIEDMKERMGAMTDRLDAGWFPEDGEVAEELDFYLDFDGEIGGEIGHGIMTSPEALQTSYEDISEGKSLLGKLAGNDEVGQHKDWSTEFQGWGATGDTSPELLLRTWFDQVDDQAAAWAVGEFPLSPNGSPVNAVYVTEGGQDLRQLVQKFLGCSVAFSQGADDYLDDDDDGKGLLADNTTAEEGKPYTALEHAWDEAFGYFGATRDYDDYSDDDIAGSGTGPHGAGYFDSNGDGSIDLLSEHVFGHAVNAGRRDRGASDAAPTDFTQGAWDGFLSGRALIAGADGELTDEQLSTLQGHRDQAVANWEGAVAATVVHYINDVLQDMDTFDTTDYSFEDHAKHWSEGKGFGLCFQFNPRSPMTDLQFGELHDLLGIAPVLPGDADAADSYRADLVAARALVGEAFGFDAANLGDEHGTGGW